MLTPRNRMYGWKPDLADFRDRKYSVARPPLKTRPPKADLRAWDSPIFDQGQLGSCTAHALAGDYLFQERKAAVKDLFMPSRLFIYWNERFLENSTQSDSGAMIRDGIKVLKSVGVCKEELWGYDRDFKQKPSTKAFQDAKKRTISQYLSIDTIDEMRDCLAQGNPVVFGFSVYESFESPAVAKTGIVPMPEYGEEQLGGHAVLAVGYDDSIKRIIVRNSWGPDWGDKGYFYMPYAYIENRDLSDDFWNIVHLT